MHMSLRDEPKLGSYHLDTSNLAIYIRFGIEDKKATIPGPPANFDLSSHVDRISRAPGTSRLQGVSMAHKGKVYHLFRLETIWITEQGKAHEQENVFEVEENQWYYIQSQYQWAKAMNDLVYAPSDRAVLHRCQNLNSEEAHLDSDDRLIHWDQDDFDAPAQVLANHMVHSYIDPESGESVFSPILALHDHADDEKVEVKLPCGHLTAVSIGRIKMMSATECLGAVCKSPYCRKFVITSKDRVQLQLAVDREELAVWKVRQIEWQAFDAPIIDNGTTLELSSHALFDSLSGARKSLAAPRSVTPLAYSPDMLDENHDILQYLGSVLLPTGFSIKVAPVQALQELKKYAIEALRYTSAFGEDDNLLQMMLAPDYEHFIDRWLTRTINRVANIQSARSREQTDETLKDVLGMLSKVSLHKDEKKANAEAESMLARLMGDMAQISLESDEVKVGEAEEVEELVEATGVEEVGEEEESQGKPRSEVQGAEYEVEEIL
jgi:hypothetical protein